MRDRDAWRSGRELLGRDEEEKADGAQAGDPEENVSGMRHARPLPCAGHAIEAAIAGEEAELVGGCAGVGVGGHDEKPQLAAKMRGVLSLFEFNRAP